MVDSGSPPKKELWSSTRGACRAMNASRPWSSRKWWRTEPGSRRPRVCASPPAKTKVEFHYTCLSLSVPSRVRFHVQLEGYDRDWVDADARRVAYYTNLPPGH